MQTQEGYRRFLEYAAPFQPVAGVPEISLHQIEHAQLPRHNENWSLVTWPGGRWLARYVLDNAADFAGKRALDIGTGSGLVAIALAKAGAEVTAIDFRQEACWGAEINADRNDVSIKVVNTSSDAYTGYDQHDVLTAADIFYGDHFDASLFRVIDRVPYVLYAADGSAGFNLSNLASTGDCWRVLPEAAKLITLQARTDREVSQSLPTAVKIVNPGPARERRAPQPA